jgi:hypothetical protein
LQIVSLSIQTVPAVFMFAMNPMTTTIPKPSSRAWLSTLALVTVVSSMPALAALGGDVSSVQNDRTRFKASLRLSPAAHYSVHELKAPTGTVIREYVTDDGRVFGVTWQGPWRPDLRQLLGPYFADFQQAAKAKRTGRNGPLSSRSSHLVIEMSGHPRAFRGRAYVPDLVPAGVSEDEIQ